MNINIKVIEHKKHRYPTVGDWFYDKNGGLQIRVSKMSDPRYEQLVAFHELFEAMLCDAQGIDEQAVTDFDVAFTGQGEPGDDPRAPYHVQHCKATAMERLLAAELGVDWNEYGQEVSLL